jgi:dTDP-4-dehydrorhamnose 3,5-epimerase
MAATPDLPASPAPAVATLHDTALPGCRELRFSPHRDARGSFQKFFRADQFQALGLRADWREEFVSVSNAGVIRGMHFQVPPAQHAKLVVCLAGRVLDVVVDLRRGSPTQGRCAAVELSAARANGLFVPEGFAHGFLSLEDGSTLLYKVSAEHAPACDQGIRWDSFGFDWPIAAPLVSPRDAALPPLASFQSPFGG